MKKRLVIVGAGGFGREVHSWVDSSPQWRAREGIGEIVFLEDGASKVSVRAPIVSTVSDFTPSERDTVICAIGAPDMRRGVVEMLLRKGVQMTTFVHDRAIVGNNVTMAAGTVICPNVLVSCDVEIGRHVHINTGCSIGHDVIIGDYVTLSSACNLTGNVTVEDGAFLATAVSVTPGRRIGAGSLVGVGSVVLRDVPAGVTVFGNPSKIIGKRPA